MSDETEQNKFRSGELEGRFGSLGRTGLTLIRIERVGPEISIGLETISVWSNHLEKGSQEVDRSVGNGLLRKKMKSKFREHDCSFRGIRFPNLNL